MVSASGLLLVLLFARLAIGAEVVRLCDVLRTPAQYQRRELIITAGFRVGYEWQVLVCYDCPSNGCNGDCAKLYDVWVDFEHGVKGSSKLPKRAAFDQLEKVTFQGTFQGPGTYGHLGGYRYQFNVNEIKAATRVWKLNPKENDASAKVKASLCRSDELKAQP
jgi:hypothetical protein